MKCYLCKAPVSHFLRKNNHDIVRCPACGLATTILHKDYYAFIEEHYSKGYFTGDPHRSAYVNYRDDKPLIVRNMRKLLQKIQVQKPRGRVLDVGCALGFFVELCRRHGYDAYGFDPSNYAVREAKKLVGGQKIQLGTAQTVQYPKKFFDVITLFDVFEHLKDPRADIQKLKTFLKDDGILVIATGDTSSFLPRILKRRWTFYIPPQHLFFFNRNNLTRFLKQIGFVPTLWFRVSKWLSLRYVLHLGRTTGESKTADVLYRLFGHSRAAKLPVYMPVQDNMVVIAKKAT